MCQIFKKTLFFTKRLSQQQKFLFIHQFFVFIAPFLLTWDGLLGWIEAFYSFINFEVQQLLEVLKSSSKYKSFCTTDTAALILGSFACWLSFGCCLLLAVSFRTFWCSLFRVMAYSFKFSPRPELHFSGWKFCLSLLVENGLLRIFLLPVFFLSPNLHIYCFRVIMTNISRKFQKILYNRGFWNDCVFKAHAKYITH